jgi:DNA-binding CsgD family transcriptional regulator
MKYGNILNLFLNRPYLQDQSPSEGEILKKYSLFPNEVVYMVDYKLGEIEVLTKNFNKIAGIEVPRDRSVTVLYDHVHSSNSDLFLKFTERLLNYGITGNKVFIPEKDFNISLYRTSHGKTLLKSTTLLNYDSNNLVRYSVGKLMDVTGLVPFTKFSYMFSGPNQKKSYLGFEGLLDFQFLSRREIEILKLTGEGLRSQQISELLFISRHTVDTHKRNIICKLEASGSIDAYNRAKNMGLFL